MGERENRQLFDAINELDVERVKNLLSPDRLERPDVNGINLYDVKPVESLISIPCHTPGMVERRFQIFDLLVSDERFNPNQEIRGDLLANNIAFYLIRWLPEEPRYLRKIMECPGFNHNVMDYSGRNLFLYACRFGSVETIKLLEEDIRMDIGARTDDNQRFGAIECLSENISQDRDLEKLRYLLSSRYTDRPFTSSGFEIGSEAYQLALGNMIERLRTGKTAVFAAEDLRGCGVTIDELSNAICVANCELPGGMIEDPELDKAVANNAKEHEAQTARQKEIIRQMNMMMNFYARNEGGKLSIQNEIGAFYFPIKRELLAVQQYTDLPDRDFKAHMAEFVGNLFLDALREKGRLDSFEEKDIPKTGADMFEILQRSYLLKTIPDIMKQGEKVKVR